MSMAAHDIGVMIEKGFILAVMKDGRITCREEGGACCSAGKKGVPYFSPVFLARCVHVRFNTCFRSFGVWQRP